MAVAGCAEEVLERDFFMSAPEALAFGLVDAVIQQRPPPQATDATADEGGNGGGGKL